MLDHRPVLVVEDSDDDFDTVTHAARLARLSNRLVRAVDAADALDAITLHPQGFFAFVLLDYNLPGVDGLAFLYEIRLDCSARHPEIEQHADLDLRRSKVIEKLSFVGSIKRSTGL